MTFWTLLSLSLLLAILGLTGRVRLIRLVDRYTDRLEFAATFLDNLNRYVESGGSDMDIYTWLIRNSTRMQLESGSFGIMAHYKPPYERVVYSNYRIFMNCISDLRYWLTEIRALDTAEGFYLMMYEALQRHSAHLEHRREELLKRAGNPIECIAEGVAFVLSIPLLIIGWTGLIGTGTASRFSRSRFLEVISKLTLLLGVIGTIVGIIADWKDFFDIVIGWFN